MNNKLIKLALFALSIFCIYSCKENNDIEKIEKEISEKRPEFSLENHHILDREITAYDIKEIVDVEHGSSFQDIYLKCELRLFNYGEDICLYNMCADDCFTDLGKINYICLLRDDDDINIVNNKHSEKYGDWAVVNLNIGNNYVNDVFMSPLAMNAYKKYNKKNDLVFIQFTAYDKYMNVLFYGSPTLCIILLHNPNFIKQGENHFSMSGNKKNPGPFWHVINR